MAALPDPERLAALRVVCLPDLFLDHIVEAPAFDVAVEAIERVHARGGGNVRGWRQRLHAGGNAANTARALARLGLEVRLVARTDLFARAFAQTTLGRDGVDLALVRADGEGALTTALEFGPGRANVMLNHPGSVATFGPDDLDEPVCRAIGEADAVVLANWGNTREHGTPLIEAVAGTAGPSTLTYLDTSDVSDRLDEVEELIETVAKAGIRVWAMNEVELGCFVGEREIEEAGAVLAERTGAVVDVHTKRQAWSFEAGPVHRAAAPERAVLRSTGAGDAWNAGNLVGHLLDLPAEERLALAHRVAGATLSDPEGVPPAWRDVWGT